MSELILIKFAKKYFKNFRDLEFISRKDDLISCILTTDLGRSKLAFDVNEQLRIITMIDYSGILSPVHDIENQRKNLSIESRYNLVKTQSIDNVSCVSRVYESFENLGL